MPHKKLSTKIKSLQKKVLKDLKKETPDFAAIATNFSTQVALINDLRNKASKKIIKKNPVKMKKKSSPKKPAVKTVKK